MKRYLITGATGFLGTWIIRLLKEQGDVQVVSIARTTSHELSELGVVQVQGSILDRDLLAKTCKEHNFDGIFHLAGYVEHSRRNPKPMFKLHVDGTLAILEAAKSHQIRRVVYASTSGTVGCSHDPKYVASDTSDYATAVVGDWPYYASKIKAEQKAIEFHRQNPEVELVSMRPTLILGPGDIRESSVTLIKEFINKNIPLVPAGGLSLVDVRDVAKAFVTAMDAGTPGATYLLGAANLSHAELYADLYKITGIRGPFLRVPAWILIFVLKLLYFFTYKMFGIWLKTKDPVWAEMGQVFWSIDSSSAKRDLQFSPRPYMETLRETVEWLQARVKQ
eukprot:NODE_812_length_1175_cov_83.484733_g771_i0.p1 GENE.NODE_812_length_1175_cov_83.484733_g771_i0~~NODE_812_length_1175_cov_83.484733_g771_i0.p1  ORF type:complete len:362 (-),score=58.32 NODE_812_length_1175_cov_83.484733_g771_i0:88-1092(-)